MTDLPTHWNKTTLKDCCLRPEYGYTASASSEQVGPKFLRITDIQNGSVDWEKVPYAAITDKLKNSLYLGKGDIVIARIGATTGKAFLIGDCPKAVFASYLIRLRTKPPFSPEFLSYCLQTQEYWEQINQRKGGRLKGGINIPNLENLSVPMPPGDEQRAIAHTLQTVQKAQNVRHRELAQERERMDALTEYFFTCGTRGEPTKESDIGVIPASWQVCPLGDVVTVKGGKRLPKGVPFAEHRTPHPYIRVVDFVDGSVNTKDLKYLTSSVQQMISRYTISKDDVYISIAGTIGLVGTVPEALNGANLTENAAKLVIKDASTLDKKFLSLFLAAGSGQSQIENLTARTTQPKLALNRIEQIKIPVPALPEQRHIAMTLHAAATKLASLAREIDCLDELFDALLEGLMSGHLSVVPLTQERESQ